MNVPKPKKHTKAGRMNKQQLDYIKSNANSKTYIEIAQDLGREASSIKKAMIKMGFSTDLSAKTFNVMHIAKLEDKEFWPALAQQFDEEELEMFKMHWRKFFDQFKGDVFPTEELQIMDIIRLELLMKRNLDEQYKTRKELQELEAAYIKESNKHDNDKDFNIVNNLAGQIAALRTAQSSIEKGFKESLDRKNKMFDQMKGTRAARIDKVESSRESFFQWMKQIIENPQVRRELGIWMQKMRLAAIDEQIRLAALHRYEDNCIDQPLLTPETVK